MFATPAYVIHQCERPIYEWRDVVFSAPSQECTLACLSVVHSLFQTVRLRLEDNHSHAMSAEYVWIRIWTEFTFRGNIFDILEQQHMHSHHKIRTQNAYRNIPRGKKQKACLHFTIHQLTVAYTPRSLHYHVSFIGQAHWTSMTSRTAYCTSTLMKSTLFSGHYLRNRSTLDIVVWVISV